jgi:hypothetical protein
MLRTRLHGLSVVIKALEPLKTLKNDLSVHSDPRFGDAWAHYTLKLHMAIDSIVEFGYENQSAALPTRNTLPQEPHYVCLLNAAFCDE